MGLTAREPEGTFELAPEGTHVARCYMVVDMGMQETGYGPKHKAKIGFELPNELMEDGRPFSVSQNYTVSLSEKANLRADLEAWRGRAFTEDELRGFDVFNVLGAPAMVTVIHTTNEGKTYANIKSVSALPKGMQAPAAINEPIKFSLEEYSQEVFDSLPEYLRNKINRGGIDAPYMPPQSDHPADDSFDDDIPF
jgi:hypothetical protein